MSITHDQPCPCHIATYHETESYNHATIIMSL